MTEEEIQEMQTRMATLAAENEKMAQSNKTILEEKKQAQQKLQDWEGYDLDDVKKTMQVLAQNEDASLIKEGKIDELIAKRTDAMQARMQEQEKAIAASKQEAEIYRNQYNQSLVDESVRRAALASKLKVRPNALSDILDKARQVFTLDGDGKVVARDKNGELMKTEDGLMLTQDKFIESLIKSHDYYFEGSAGGGLSSQDLPTTNDDLAKQMDAAVKAGDMKRYKELRGKLFG